MNKSELEQRFLSLVDSYKQVIYKVCFMYATDDETISDLYQEVVPSSPRNRKGNNCKNSIGS